MLKNFEYDFSSKEAEFLLKVINNDFSSLNEYLLFHLEVIDVALTKLKEEPNSAVEVSAVKELFDVYLLADKVLTLTDKRRKSIKLKNSKFEAIKTNAKSVVNGVEKVAELNKEHLIKKDALTFFIYLSS